MPYIYLFSSGNCNSTNYLIHETEREAFITKSLRYSYKGSNEHYIKYSTTKISPDRKDDKVYSEGTIITKRSINLDSLSLETIKSFTISSNKDKDLHPIYIDPIAIEGFRLRVYLYRAGWKMRISGLKNTPTSICQKKIISK